MSLEEAIAQQINLGVKDPLEIARVIIKRNDIHWLSAELVAHGEEILAEIARQTLGRERRGAVLQAIVVGPKPKRAPKRALMLAPTFIPGVGWKSFGDCTTDDHAAREHWYLRAAGSAVRWASWHRAWIEALRAQGVEKSSQLKGPLPELPEADAA